jgi:hypothetical protein
LFRRRCYLHCKFIFSRNSAFLVFCVDFDLILAKVGKAFLDTRSRFFYVMGKFAALTTLLTLLIDVNETALEGRH